MVGTLEFLEESGPSVEVGLSNVSSKRPIFCWLHLNKNTLAISSASLNRVTVYLLGFAHPINSLCVF